MKRLAPVLAIVALILAGCTSWSGVGVVTDKEHRGAYTMTTMVMSGKTMVPVITHIPECYRLVVRANEDNKEHDLCFDQGTWSQYEVGSRITVTEENK